MKKNLLFGALAIVALTMLHSCSQDSFDFIPEDSSGSTTRAVVDGTITFEDVSLGTENSVYNLSYSHNGLLFSNYSYLDPEFSYKYWDGFSYSCKGNNVLTDIENGQFDVYHEGGAITTGAGYNSNQFAIAYVGTYYGNYPTITFDDPVYVTSFYVNNTAYTVTSMMNGDGFAKKFVQGDWFKLTIKGYSATDSTTPVYTKELYLADYTATDSTKWTMIKDWKLYDEIGEETSPVRKLVFDLSSSDSGQWGMNTPAYFAIDNLDIVKAE